MKNDFEATVDFLIVKAPTSNTQNNQNHNVSGVNFNKNKKKSNPRKWSRKGAKRGKIDVGPTTGVEIRFYQPGEWKRLTQDQRDECISIRRKRKGGEDNHDNPDTPQSEIANQGNERAHCLCNDIS